MTEIVSPLGLGVTTFGRAPDNDVVLRSSGASRYHFRIEVLDGRVVLEDLNSSTGVAVSPTGDFSEESVVHTVIGHTFDLSRGDVIAAGEDMIVLL